MSSCSKFFDTARRLACSWYSVDRIRIAPTTGRLLQAEVGDSLVLLNELYSVLQRRVDSTAGGHRIIYVLEGATDQRELTVLRDDATDRIHGELIIDDTVQPVFDSDLVIVKSESLRD